MGIDAIDFAYQEVVLITSWERTRHNCLPCLSVCLSVRPLNFIYNEIRFNA